METFGKARAFIEDSGYIRARRSSIAALDLNAIDRPIRDIIDGVSGLSHCFTLQCCYGHFICDAGQDHGSLKPVPAGYAGPVRYRIAYIAFCLENSNPGRELGKSFAKLAAIDPEYIQFGSADWFWAQWPNSFALQVEPVQYMLQDEAILESHEARYIQGVRDRFFGELRVLLAKELDNSVVGRQSP